MIDEVKTEVEEDVEVSEEALDESLENFDCRSRRYQIKQLDQIRIAHPDTAMRIRYAELR